MQRPHTMMNLVGTWKPLDWVQTSLRLGISPRDLIYPAYRQSESPVPMSGSSTRTPGSRTFSTRASSWISRSGTSPTGKYETPGALQHHRRGSHLGRGDHSGTCLIETVKILAIVPAYNEEETIGEVILSLKGGDPPWISLCVNDGSRDRTSEKAAETKKAWSPSDLPLQPGYRRRRSDPAGFLHAVRGIRCCLQFDGDGQHRPPGRTRSWPRFLPARWTWSSVPLPRETKAWSTAVTRGRDQALRVGEFVSHRTADHRHGFVAGSCPQQSPHLPVPVLPFRLPRAGGGHPSGKRRLSVEGSSRRDAGKGERPILHHGLPLRLLHG